MPGTITTRCELRSVSDMPQPGSEPAADLVRRLWSDAQDLLSTGWSTPRLRPTWVKQQDYGPAQPFRYASGNGRGEPAVSLVTANAGTAASLTQRPIAVARSAPPGLQQVGAAVS